MLKKNSLKMVPQYVEVLCMGWSGLWWQREKVLPQEMRTGHYWWLRRQLFPRMEEEEVRNLRLRLELVETTIVWPEARGNFRRGKGRRLSIWWKEQLPKSRGTMDNGPVLSQDNAAKERRRSSEQGGVKGKPESRWHGAGNGKLRRFSREKC